MGGEEAGADHTLAGGEGEGERSTVILISLYVCLNLKHTVDLPSNIHLLSFLL